MRCAACHNPMIKKKGEVDLRAHSKITSHDSEFVEDFGDIA